MSQNRTSCCTRRTHPTHSLRSQLRRAACCSLPSAPHPGTPCRQLQHQSIQLGWRHAGQCRTSWYTVTKDRMYLRCNPQGTGGRCSLEFRTAQHTRYRRKWATWRSRGCDFDCQCHMFWSTGPKPSKPTPRSLRGRKPQGMRGFQRGPDKPSRRRRHTLQHRDCESGTRSHRCANKHSRPSNPTLGSPRGRHWHCMHVPHRGHHSGGLHALRHWSQYGISSLCRRHRTSNKLRSHRSRTLRSLLGKTRCCSRAAR